MIIRKVFKYIHKGKVSKVSLKRINIGQINSLKFQQKEKYEVYQLCNKTTETLLYITKKEFSKIDLYKEKNINQCPHCKGKEFIKFGFYNGIQRYKCKHCNKTFSKTTTSLWKYSKKNAVLWNDFFYAVFKRHTLRYCAKELGISVMTAFYWRHKIFYALGKGLFDKKLNGDVVYLCSMNIIQNDKGNFKCKKILPNVSKHDYYAYSILYRNFIPVVAAKSLNNQFMIKAIKIANKRYDEDDFNKKIHSYIDSKTYIKPYYGREIKKYAISHNNHLPKKIQKNKSFVCKDKKHCFFSDNVEDDINFENIYVELYGWLDRYNGVGSKYLQNYFYLFGFMYMNKKIKIYNMCLKLLYKDAFITIENFKKFSSV